MLKNTRFTAKTVRFPIIAMALLFTAATAIHLPASGLATRGIAADTPAFQNVEAAAADTAEAAWRLILAPTGNTARYLVRERLAGFDFPNDAVGETGEVTGVVVFDREGNVLADQSRVVVNITGLTSDSNRRDGFIQRNTLQGETYPEVVLVPLMTRGLTFPLPGSGAGTFDIIGNLTVREVTQPTSWRVTAQFGEGSLSGTARTEFTFDEFELEKPRVRSVLSVADAIRLELDFSISVEHIEAE
jgi:polyisoprenoid-binding protein YceI